MTNKNLTYKVAVIGGGQAGLATSYYLKKSGIEHTVLEENTIGNSWIAQRWDSFKMNTPNWMTELPRMPLLQEKREEFMTKNEFVSYLNHYAQEFDLPVLEQHKVIWLHHQNSRFEILIEHQNNQKTIYADIVVIASGIMNKAKLPKLSEKISKNIIQFHASEYKNPKQLPIGSTLVIGGGQSGCQIAEELALAGKTTYLATSKVPRAPRRYRGKDIMEWLDIMGIQDTTAQQLRENPKLNATQPQSSGVGIFGHTLSYQSLHQSGVSIMGSLKDFDLEKLYFAKNAEENIQFADSTSKSIKENIDVFIAKNPEWKTEIIESEDIADLPDIVNLSASTINEINIKDANITSIIWATGFGSDFSYLNSSLLDQLETPRHIDGIVKPENLYCIGFPWLRKKKSGLVFGVKEDAKVIVENIKESLKLKNYA